jgi:hypothetical protein
MSNGDAMKKMLLAVFLMTGCAHGYYTSDVGARMYNRDGKLYKVYRCHYRYHCDWRYSHRYGKTIYQCNPDENAKLLCDYDMVETRH